MEKQFKSVELAKFSKEVEVGVRSIHLACLVCEKIQETLVSNSNHRSSPALIAAYSVQTTIGMILSEAFGFGTQNLPIFSDEISQTISNDDLEAILKIVNACLSESPRFGLKTLVATSLDVIKYNNSSLHQNRRFWVLNPIDNVLGFVDGDQYAISLALIDEGEVVVGVIGCPNKPLKKELLSYQKSYRALISKLMTQNNFGCIVYTERHSGKVWSQPLLLHRENLVWPHFAKKIKVSTVDDIKSAVFCEPFLKPNSSHSFTAGVFHSIGRRNQVLRVHNTMKYLAIAQGDAEVFMKFTCREKISDHAAGVIIIQEAGGIVTDISGNILDFSNGNYIEQIDRGILACAGPKLHMDMIANIDASFNSSCL